MKHFILTIKKFQKYQDIAETDIVGTRYLRVTCSSSLEQFLLWDYIRFRIHINR